MSYDIWQDSYNFFITSKYKIWHDYFHISIHIDWAMDCPYQNQIYIQNNFVFFLWNEKWQTNVSLSLLHRGILHLRWKAHLMHYNDNSWTMLRYACYETFMFHIFRFSCSDFIHSYSASSQTRDNFMLEESNIVGRWL